MRNSQKKLKININLSSVKFIKKIQNIVIDIKMLYKVIHNSNLEI